MNDLFEQEIRYKILKMLSAEPNLSQRVMAGRMGISLGKTNYVLSELAEKGIIKMKRFKNAPHKTPYTYMLTPHGLEQKAKITVRFLKRKLSEYEIMKAQIKEVAADFKRDQNMDASETSILEKLAKI